MSLSDIEVRILGSLIEKEHTTPEGYPLSTNALVLACNQKSSRSPVTSYNQLEVEETLRLLRDKGLTTTIRGASERAFKHRHKLNEAFFNVNPKGFAILGVLMLRGLQTAGELRTRTERYTRFDSLAEIDATLEQLVEHRPPLVKNHGRGPGQSQDRWGQTLGIDPEKQKPRARAAPITSEDSKSTSDSALTSNKPIELEELKQELQQLKLKVNQIMKHLGLEKDEEP